MLRGEGLGGPERLAEDDEHHPAGGRREQRQRSDLAMSGIATEGSPLGTSPTTATPWAERSSAQLSAMPSTRAISPPGRRGRQALDAEQQHQCGRPDRERGPARVAELAEQVDELADRVVVALLDPEELRELADGDEDREPEDEALHDRPRQELGDEAEPQGPPQEQHAAEEHQPAARAAYSSAPDGLRSATPEASRTAAAEVPATTTCRLVPKIA